MSDILTLKSKEKLGCDLCDKCCKYRGDIRLTPVNVCEISDYLKITNEEFLYKYTDKLNNGFEIVLKTKGEIRQCVLYEESEKKCMIHKVKPMQCVMFPLIPESIKRDYFINSNQCKKDTYKEITIKEWLNGNGNIYKNHKKFCMEWINFIENIQDIENELKDQKESELCKLKKESFNTLFLNYNIRKSIEKQALEKMNSVTKGYISLKNKIGIL